MTVIRLAAHAQWFSHQNDEADYHDVHLMMSQEWLMPKREGTIKEGVQLLRRFVWVFRHTLEGLHLSHRPSTSAVLVPLM